MRILANYGYKSNGDSYSVTMESQGDIPIGQADLAADELFGLAKQAIQRQLNSQPKPEKCCNCNAPVTPRQKYLIIKLARERGQFIDLEGMTVHAASDLIERLMSNAA